MNRLVKKVLAGIVAVAAVSGLLVGGAYAVFNNPGTAFVEGPKRQVWLAPVDQSKVFLKLGGAPNKGAFGIPWAASASLGNYVDMYGHQPYTLPDDPFNQ